MVETTEILILRSHVLSIKARKLLTRRDYVLVDEVNLIAQILVGDNVVLVNISEDYFLINNLFIAQISSEDFIEFVNILELHVTR